MYLPDFFGLSGRALSIDLDTVVCGPLDQFFDLDAPFIAIDTSDDWRLGGEPCGGAALVVTGIFVFNIGARTQLSRSSIKTPRLRLKNAS